jgi:1-pyrroline-5-carboxylate dehydrogenase
MAQRRAGSSAHPPRVAVAGEWCSTTRSDGDLGDRELVLDPLQGGAFLNVPSPRVTELKPFLASLARVPKSGLHNPFRGVERYLMLGEVSNKAGAALRVPAVADYFARLIQRTSPKSYAQV